MSDNRKDELYLSLRGARELLCLVEVAAGPEGSSTRRHVQAAIDAIDCAAWCSGVGMHHPFTFPERWPVELSTDPPGVLVQHPGALEATRLMRPDDREGWWLMLANAVATGLSPMQVNRLVMEDADVLAAERIGRRTAAARITYEAGRETAVRDLRNRGWRQPSRLSQARARVRRWWRT